MYVAELACLLDTAVRVFGRALSLDHAATEEYADEAGDGRLDRLGDGHLARRRGSGCGGEAFGGFVFHFFGVGQKVRCRGGLELPINMIGQATAEQCLG